MKTLKILAAVLFISNCLIAQRQVEESYPVNNQQNLKIDFPFANEIDLKSWDKNEVLVKATVTINDGEDNELFELKSSTTGTKIEIFTEKDAYSQAYSKNKNKHGNCWETEINYEVYVPKRLLIDVESISGDILYEYLGKPVSFKTISGDIELKIADKQGADLDAKTISGEIYSNMDIDHTDGKKGLKQMVGMKLRGTVNNGGELLELETISGDIFLREI